VGPRGGLAKAEVNPMKILRHLAAGAIALLLVICFGATAAARDGSAWSGPPRIDGFDVEQVPQLAPGTQLVFTLFGSPRAQASLRIDGAERPLALAEHEPGVYEGVYTLTERDHIAADARVVGDLRQQGELVSSVLEEPLVLGTSRPAGAPEVAIAQATTPAPAAVPPVPPAATEPCTNCGIVESIDVRRSASSSSWLGTIAGGLIGALLGDQVARGDEHRNTARILGAVGGAYAGHEIERNARTRDRYDVVVRLRNGDRRTFSFEQAPPLHVGDGVVVADGQVRRPQP